MRVFQVFGSEGFYNIDISMLLRKIDVLYTGLGSALIEQLRDDYPMAYILSVLVAPFSYGETPLQHYNTLLCLSRLQDHCDSTLVFRNDSVLDQVQRQAAMSGVAGGRTKDGGCFTEGNSIEDMNRHISLSLCNSFLPLWSPKPRYSYISMV